MKSLQILQILRKLVAKSENRCWVRISKAKCCTHRSAKLWWFQAFECLGVRFKKKLTTATTKTWNRLNFVLRGVQHFSFDIRTQELLSDMCTNLRWIWRLFVFMYLQSSITLFCFASTIFPLTKLKNFVCTVKLKKWKSRNFTKIRATVSEIAYQRKNAVLKAAHSYDDLQFSVFLRSRYQEKVDPTEHDIFCKYQRTSTQHSPTQKCCTCSAVNNHSCKAHRHK